MKKQEIEGLLEQKSLDIQGRIDALQHEVTSTGVSIKAFVSERPYLALSGALIAGVIVGKLLSGRRTSTDSAHQAIMEQYVRAVNEDIQKALKKGSGFDEALTDTIRRRIPLILHSTPGKHKKGGVFRTLLNMSMNIVLHQIGKVAGNYLISSLDQHNTEPPEQPSG